MKILIVGPDAELCAITGKILGRIGCGTVCRIANDVLSTASISRENIACENAALVIAELEADETERIRFCKAVKSICSPPKLMIIDRSREEETTMLNAGADDWIEKPYITDVFLERVSALLGRCAAAAEVCEREEY